MYMLSTHVYVVNSCICCQLMYMLLTHVHVVSSCICCQLMYMFSTHAYVVTSCICCHLMIKVALASDSLWRTLEDMETESKMLDDTEAIDMKPVLKSCGVIVKKQGQCNLRGFFFSLGYPLMLIQKVYLQLAIIHYINKCKK